MQGLRKMSVSIRAVTQHRCMPMWLWKQRLKPLAEFQIIFLTCTIRAEKCEIFSTRISSSLYFICSFTWIIFSDNHILRILPHTKGRPHHRRPRQLRKSRIHAHRRGHRLPQPRPWGLGGKIVNRTLRTSRTCVPPKKTW